MMARLGLMILRIGVEVRKVGRVGVVTRGVVWHDDEPQPGTETREGVIGKSPYAHTPCGLVGGKKLRLSTMGAPVMAS